MLRTCCGVDDRHLMVSLRARPGSLYAGVGSRSLASGFYFIREAVLGSDPEKALRKFTYEDLNSFSILLA